MKNLFVLAIGALLLTSCGAGGGNDQFVGQWKLEKFVSDGEDKTTECDKNTVWDFTSEKDVPLGDGTEVMKLKATAPADCEWYGFDAKWTTKDGQLFVSTSKVGGMGGNSMAGLFDVVKVDDTEMEIKVRNNVLTFKKQ